MKVYISGAITNNEYYKQQFAEAEEKLTAEGHSVINPAKNQGYTYKEYIDIGLFELMHCDAIYMLEGWENSTGAKLEREYAVAVGLLVLGCKPEDKPFELTDKDKGIIKNFISKKQRTIDFDETQSIVKLLFEIYRRG